MANRAMMERDMASAPQRTQGLYLPLPLSTERSAMEPMIGSLMPSKMRTKSVRNETAPAAIPIWSVRNTAIKALIQ